MPKIYILGSVGSGKTMLGKKLATELNINHYELDNIVWELNPNGNDRKRDLDEIKLLFEEIINQDNWIIENVGRSFFNKGFEDADTIIYLNIKRQVLYRRVLLRWIKQNLGIEKASYKSDLKMLRQMFQWVNKELNNSKLNKLTDYQKKLVILNEKETKKYKYK